MGERCFDYYGDESGQFSFCRIPRQLITGEHFKEMSTAAKLLYVLLLDRMGLSAKNGWHDGQGRVYTLPTSYLHASRPEGRANHRNRPQGAETPRRGTADALRGRPPGSGAETGPRGPRSRRVHATGQTRPRKAVSRGQTPAAHKRFDPAWAPQRPGSPPWGPPAARQARTGCPRKGGFSSSAICR